MFFVFSVLNLNDQISILLFVDMVIDSWCVFWCFIGKFNCCFYCFCCFLLVVFVFCVDNCQWMLIVYLVVQMCYISKVDVVIDGVRCLMVFVVYCNYCYFQCVGIYFIDKIFGISIDCFCQYCCWQIFCVVFNEVGWVFLCCYYMIKDFCCFIVVQYCL